MGRTQDKAGDLLQGTLDMLVLKALVRGPLHGYAIAELIHQRSEDVLRVEEGALYPALHRLELRGLLEAEWGLSENNRRAKYYRLTASGRGYLEAESAQWGRMVAAIARVMESA
jgi:PadR family transcriptional regulator